MTITKDKFNTIIEGTYHDDWVNHHYKLSILTIPTKALQLDDGTYEYLLYGKETFPHLNPDTLEGTKYRISEGFLGFREGIVLPYAGGIPHVLERPRTIVHADGRVYVEKNMLANKNYQEQIPGIIKTSTIILNDTTTIPRIQATQEQLMTQK